MLQGGDLGLPGVGVTKLRVERGGDRAAERAAPRTGEDGPSESVLNVCPTVPGGVLS